MKKLAGILLFSTGLAMSTTGIATGMIELAEYKRLRANPIVQNYEMMNATRDALAVQIGACYKTKNCSLNYLAQLKDMEERMSREIAHQESGAINASFELKEHQNNTAISSVMTLLGLCPMLLGISYLKKR